MQPEGSSRIWCLTMVPVNTLFRGPTNHGSNILTSSPCLQPAWVSRKHALLSWRVVQWSLLESGANHITLSHNIFSSQFQRSSIICISFLNAYNIWNRKTCYTHYRPKMMRLFCTFSNAFQTSEPSESLSRIPSVAWANSWQTRSSVNGSLTNDQFFRTIHRWLRQRTLMIDDISPALINGLAWETYFSVQGRHWKLFFLSDRPAEVTVIPEFFLPRELFFQRWLT